MDTGRCSDKKHSIDAVNGKQSVPITRMVGGKNHALRL